MATQALKNCGLCHSRINKSKHISWSRYSTKKFCSRKCYENWNVGQNNPNWSSRNSSVCSVCGAEIKYKIEIPPSTRRKKYCSIECRNKVLFPVPSKDYKSISQRDRRGNRIQEHILIASKALGRPLRKGEEVHHINLNKHDNRNCNLLICTSSYHHWLHQEMVRRYVKEHFGDL